VQAPAVVKVKVFAVSIRWEPGLANRYRKTGQRCLLRGASRIASSAVALESALVLRGLQYGLDLWSSGMHGRIFGWNGRCCSALPYEASSTADGISRRSYFRDGRSGNQRVSPGNPLLMRRLPEYAL